MIKPGDWVVYQNGSRFRLRRVVGRNNADNGWFVCYHNGETAASTPDHCLHELENLAGDWIEPKTLGGERFAEMEQYNPLAD